jgi:broad specificity phosphatase PhoE
VKEVLLIRHGETDLNRDLKFIGFSDPELNDTGRRQAEALREKFMSEEITCIYSSDLRRCVETAYIISGGAEIIVSDRIREMNFGIFESRTNEEVRTEYRDEFNLWLSDIINRRIPGGESFREMSERVLDYFRQVTALDGDRIAFVSHSGCIRVILSYYLMKNMDDIWRFFIDNCTINRLCFDGDYAYLKTLNEK